MVRKYKPKPKTLHKCRCCGEEFLGRASQVYLNEKHAMRFYMRGYRARKKAARMEFTPLHSAVSVLLDIHKALANELTDKEAMDRDDMIILIDEIDSVFALPEIEPIVAYFRELEAKEA